MGTIKIPCVYMRTGTCKSLYFKDEDLPKSKKLRDEYLLAAIGSPDLAQINGMGCGSGSTSKVAIISKSDSPDYDVSYTFGQVSLTEAKIDYSGNCGNCTSGVGPYAIDERLIDVREPFTTVRIFNTNTNREIIEHVPVVDGKAAVAGDYEIDGIPGKWAPIELDFKDTVGATTGHLFPTGNRKDKIMVEGLGEVEVSIADMGNPVVFFHSDFVKSTGYEASSEINSNAELLQRIEAVREKAAEKIGLIKAGEKAVEVSQMKPLVVIFTEPESYKDYSSDKIIRKEEIHFSARNFMNQKCIDTFAATGALCTGVVASVRGTVLNNIVQLSENKKNEIHIGHSRGITEVSIHISESKNHTLEVQKASMFRTARRIMEGNVCIDIDE